MVNSKLISIFLILFFLSPLQAKPAPKNTFKLVDTHTMPFTDSEEIQGQIKYLQDKISDLRAQNHGNYFVKKFNEIRIERLENKVKEKSTR